MDFTEFDARGYRTLPVRLFSDHVRGARAAGWSLVEMEERLVDDVWISGKPKWEIYRHRPVSYPLAWQRISD